MENLAMMNAAFPSTASCRIDGALADRLHRELALALGRDRGSAIQEPILVDVSHAHRRGRSKAPKAVFRSSRAHNDHDDVFSRQCEVLPAMRHREAACSEQRLTLKVLKARRVMSDRSVEWA
jgi:hypothetical protein